MVAVDWSGSQGAMTKPKWMVCGNRMAAAEMVDRADVFVVGQSWLMTLGCPGTGDRCNVV
jgi:hypothetical protein